MAHPNPKARSKYAFWLSLKTPGGGRCAGRGLIAYSRWGRNGSWHTQHDMKVRERDAELADAKDPDNVP